MQDQLQERSFVAERLTALAASPDGCVCAGGGVSGALYAWDIASGRLLRTWPAHYQVLVFSLPKPAYVLFPQTCREKLRLDRGQALKMLSTAPVHPISRLQ